MNERSIVDLLGELPDELVPDAGFEGRLRRQLQHEWDGLRRGQTPGDVVTLRQIEEVEMNNPPETTMSVRGRWMLTSAAALVALLVGVLLFARLGADDADDPLDVPATTAPSTLPGTPLPLATERGQRAVDTATEYFAAFSSGDVETVIDLSDPVMTNVAADSELVRWWSAAAWPSEPVGEWPSGRCREIPGSDTAPVVIECPVAVTDPVARSLGVDQLFWTVDVSDDGTVRRRAEPITADLGTYAPVWSAYAEYVAAYATGEQVGACDPGTTDVGERWDVGGLALTGDCAEVTREVSGAVASWIDDGRPPAPPVEAAEIPVSPDELAGYWTNVGGRTAGSTALLVDFRRDGTFTIGNTGALGDGAFTGGTYQVSGDTITFMSDGDGCSGDGWEWTATTFTGGALTIELKSSEGCASDTGWDWVRVSPASPEGVALEAGRSGADGRRPETVGDLRGIWLRIGTGEVLSIDGDATYLMTTEGDSLSPTDTGLVRVDEPGIVVFTSDGTGACDVGETWTWSDVTTAADLLRVNNPRGTTMRTATSDLCGSSGGPTEWRLLSPDLIG